MRSKSRVPRAAAPEDTDLTAIVPASRRKTRSVYPLSVSNPVLTQENTRLKHHTPSPSFPPYPTSTSFTSGRHPRRLRPSQESRGRKISRAITSRWICDVPS